MSRNLYIYFKCLQCDIFSQHFIRLSVLMGSILYKEILMYRNAAALLLISALSIYADMIYFHGETSLECDVVKVTEQQVTIRVAKGIFAFPRDRVKHIEYNYEKKKNMLGKEDYRGHYELGVWCMDCDQEENALTQFLYVEGKPDIPDEVFLRIAQIYLKRDDKEKAIEYYRKYLATHPDDELVMKKMEDLAGSLSSKGPDTDTKKDFQKADEGLEILADWRIEKWGNPGELSLKKTIEKNVENRLLKIEYSAKNSDKTAVRLQFGGKKDLTGRKQCVMDVFNPEKRALSLAIAFVTAPGYVWYESKCKVLNPGWNLHVSYDMTENKFKAKETGWRFTSPLKNRDNVIQFIILLYNGTRKGTLYADNIQFKE